MIGSLLLLLQLSAQPAPSVLTVRSGGREVSVPLVETSAGPALRADLVAVAVGGEVRPLADRHYALTVPGAELTLIEQVPFARIAGALIPLGGAPFTDEGRLYVPFQLVVDVIPRVASGLLYDPLRGELRAFATPIAAGAPAAAASGSAPGAPGPRAAPRLGRRRLVVVDAGHGGPDHGMSGPIGSPRKIYEKDITLEVARQVADALEARGVGALMTRSRDTLIALSDRGRVANQKHGDLFLSIHVNAANLRWKDPAGARGFETYFLAEAKTEDAKRVEHMENESVRFETGANAPKGDPLSFIINDMAQNEHLRESDDLAETIQQSLARMHPGPDRGVKQANFAVLRTSFMPAVLVELGFGTNATEAAYLTDSRNQRRLAESIADATVEYLARYERRVGATPR